MAYVHPAWPDPQRKRWMRENAHLWIRPDAYRFMPPGAPRYLGKEAVRYFWPEADTDSSPPPTVLAPSEASDAEFLQELKTMQRELDEARKLLAEVKRDLAFRRFQRKYSPDQPRVPAGNPDGGQWTSGGGTAAQAVQDGLEESLTTAADQRPRSDLSELQDIANDPIIRSRIDEAWNASNPYGTSLQEHGFWISRNEATGEVFTRPFANPGSARSITPGPTPSDAIAFFHTHPLRSDFGGIAGPSRSDVGFAAAVGLPGLLQSHNGMYYFGPPFRPWRPH